MRERTNFFERGWSGRISFRSSVQIWVRFQAQRASAYYNIAFHWALQWWTSPKISQQLVHIEWGNERGDRSLMAIFVFWKCKEHQPLCVCVGGGGLEFVFVFHFISSISLVFISFSQILYGTFFFSFHTVICHFFYCVHRFCVIVSSSFCLFLISAIWKRGTEIVKKFNKGSRANEWATPRGNGTRIRLTWTASFLTFSLSNFRKDKRYFLAYFGVRENK